MELVLKILRKDTIYGKKSEKSDGMISGKDYEEKCLAIVQQSRHIDKSGECGAHRQMEESF